MFMFCRWNFITIFSIFTVYPLKPCDPFLFSTPWNVFAIYLKYPLQGIICIWDTPFRVSYVFVLLVVHMYLFCWWFIVQCICQCFNQYQTMRPLFTFTRRFRPSKLWVIWSQNIFHPFLFSTPWNVFVIFQPFLFNIPFQDFDQSPVYSSMTTLHLIYLFQGILCSHPLSIYIFDIWYICSSHICIWYISQLPFLFNIPLSICFGLTGFEKISQTLYLWLILFLCFTDLKMIWFCIFRLFSNQLIIVSLHLI